MRLTLGQITGMNHGRVAIPDSMKATVARYTNPQLVSYNNRYNIHIKQGGATVKTSGGALTEKRNREVNTDEGVLYNIRHVFGSIAKGKTDKAIEDINGLNIPATLVDRLAVLFFDTIIQCPNLTAEYLEVLTKFTPVNFGKDALYETFCKHVISRYLHPVKLEASKLETAEDRTKAFNSAICMLIALLFSSGGYRQIPVFARFFGNQTALERFLTPLFNRMESGDIPAVHNISAVYPMIRRSCGDLSAYDARVRAVYADTKLFKLSIRLLLKDLV